VVVWRVHGVVSSTSTIAWRWDIGLCIELERGNRSSGGRGSCCRLGITQGREGWGVGIGFGSGSIIIIIIIMIVM